jgi:hypothetical protein
MNSKPFGATITVPKIKAVGVRCLRLEKWAWEIPSCQLRAEPGGCDGCIHAQKLVGTVEAMLNQAPPGDKT